MRGTLLKIALYVTFCIALTSACEQKGAPPDHTDFTKTDSVTETYPAVRDTMVYVWNSMLHDNNRKIKAMRHLLSGLLASGPDKKDELKD